jgi:hypothetical protein
MHIPWLALADAKAYRQRWTNATPNLVPKARRSGSIPQHRYSPTKIVYWASFVSVDDTPNRAKQEF